ncbi:hypothetical protein G9C85_02595 [Halorubellus sp. JP-L1]|uniref:hypothetical protein n=1 Tax=Halorubellus sp. JP-L1 TaxID=2715753 RepID=UPI00140E1964|nr:hypothetical protein [Halorubellus sp. JP-L1]NHN40527.1 hypothetical protein [Halorubellus sp. JP-L1]
MPEHNTELGLEGVQTEPMSGGIAFDLVTRQPLFVVREVADGLAEYHDEEDFDLLGYKTHPYLPVRADDTVYECVYLSDITIDGVHTWGDTQTYDFPRGRLAHVPIEQAWSTGGDD